MKKPINSLILTAAVAACWWDARKKAAGQVPRKPKAKRKFKFQSTTTQRRWTRKPVTASF